MSHNDDTSLMNELDLILLLNMNQHFNVFSRIFYNVC